MNVMIVGAGAIGLLLAAKLGHLCDRLELVTHTEDQAMQLLANGIILDDQTVRLDSQIHVRSYEKSANGISVEQPDYIILSVKQTAIDQQLVQFIADQRRSDTKLVCFQNGIGHIEKLQGVIPSDRLYIAVTTEGARKISPFKLAHTGQGITYIGTTHELSVQEVQEQTKDLCKLLKSAGFCVGTSNRIIDKIWNKLVINAIINPLTALLGITNGQLLQIPEAVYLMESLYKEAVQAADLQAVELSADLWEQLLDVCRRTSSNHSSMLQDISAGRITEIDAINGMLLQIGDAAGLEMPVNRTIYQLVKAKETS